MIKFLNTLVVILLFSSSPAFAQKIDLKRLEGMKARSIGPAGMSGRVTTIDVDLSNPEVIYAGTASGGVWRSKSGGISWEPIFDDQPVQSVGALAINQSNPAEIWVGTGEGNPRNSHNSGNGIYKSIDGGKSWMHLGLEATKNIHRIIIDQSNPEIVYVGAQGSAWGPSEHRGVYKTTDGGETWEKILFVNDSTGVADMVVDPTNPNKLLVAMWEFGRKPWFFNSGGKGSGIFITHDGGKNWKKAAAKDGLPTGDLGRIGLAIAPSSPNIIYALVEAKKNGLYRSTDGGQTWKLRASKNIGNRPFYYADIFVDPKNENRIFNLHSLVTKSEDGGKTFETLLPYSGVHPDHHAFWAHPDNPVYMIEGNDGGLNISRDGGDNWRFIENLPLAQFYHINYDMELPYHIYGGMQDNGSWRGPAYTWQRGGIRNYDFQELYFGDGFDVVPRPDNSRYVYAMSQGGNVAYIDTETGKTKNIKPYHPDGEKLRFNWNAAIAQNPFHNCGVYFGSQYLHKSLDCGNTWEIISPDLTTNDTSKQKQYMSGGLTIDDTRAENFTTIVSIAPSPHDENVIWVGTDDGNLQLTKDGGKNWTNLASRLPNYPAGSWITQIVVSPHKAGETFIVINDYRRNNWEPMVYHTLNNGESFSRLVDADDVEGHAWSIVQDPVEPKLLFVGTDYGLYVTFDKGRNWNKWTNGYPSTPTRDLKIHPREHDLIIGTFGRAAYILDDIRPLRAIAKTGGAILEEPFKVFETPEAYQVSYKPVEGVRFVADGHFIGSNRPGGARITMYVNPNPPQKEETAKEEEEKDKKKKDRKKKKKDMEEEKQENKGKRSKGGGKQKFKMQVFNMDGDTLRTREIELDTGINRFGWYFDKKGIRYPSYREIKPDAPEPRGGSVLPGTYKIKFTLGDLSDSTMVTVNPDPRLAFDMEAMKAEDAAMEDFHQLVKKATTAMDQLKDAKKTIGRVNEALVNVPDSTRKEIQKLGKTLQDSIRTLQKLYSNPPGMKGIQRVQDGLNSSLYTASSYIRASDGPPNQSARNAIAKAERHTKKVVDRINQFFEKDFNTYQEKVEAIKFSLFKEREPVKVD